MSTFDGISGWIAAKAMERMNAEAEHEAVSRLDPMSGHRVLAIGFGPGLGLARLLALPVGAVVGVDPSSVMHRVAARRNRAALAQGRLVLIRAVAAAIDQVLGQFDGAIAVNTLQMRRPIQPTADKLALVMKPGSRLVSITHGWAAVKDHGSVENFVRANESAFQVAGFAAIGHGPADAESGKAILIEATR